MSDLEAWLFSAPAGDAPPGDPTVELFEWDWVWVLHSPAETVRRGVGVQTLDARRLYGWWRTAEVRQMVQDAHLVRLAVGAEDDRRDALFWALDQASRKLGPLWAVSL